MAAAVNARLTLVRATTGTVEFLGPGGYLSGPGVERKRSVGMATEELAKLQKDVGT